MIATARVFFHPNNTEITTRRWDDREKCRGERLGRMSYWVVSLDGYGQ